MDIENPVKERISAFTGQKSELDHTLLVNSDCESVLNFTTRKGRLRKCWGKTLYAELAVAEGNRISFLDRFRNRWIAQQGGKVAWESAESSKNMVEVGDIRLGDVNKIFAEKWQNRIYLTNGVENKFLEDPGSVAYAPDDTYLTLGLVPPGRGAKIVQFQPDIVLTDQVYVGSLLADAEYGYVVTWWDANRQVESLPWGAQVGEDGLWLSFAFSFATSIAVTKNSGVDHAMRVNIQALKAFGYDAKRVTHFIVYRWTQADNATLKRVSDPRDINQEAELRIANDFYDDRTVEADLGQVLDESLSPPPSGLFYQGYGNPDLDVSAIGPRFVKFFRDQLWLFGIRLPGTENGTELQPDGFSARQVNYAAQNGIAYGSAVGNFDYWQYSYDIGRATDQRDTGMAVWKNTLMFFKERSAYYLDGSNPENYQIRELDRSRGIVAEGSLQETTIGPLGLSTDGFSVFDSGGGQVISVEVGDVVDSINLAFAHLITSSFDPAEEKYRCHVPTTPLEKNTLVCVYDIKTKSWTFESAAGGAEYFATDSKGRNVGMMGDHNNGRLYDASDRSKVTFNGQTIFGSWLSKHVDFSAPERLKTLQRITITAKGVWDFRLSVDVIPDFGEQEGFSIDDVAPDIRGDQWAEDADDPDGMNWDEGQWAAKARRKKFTILAQCVAKNIQIGIRNSDKDADRASFEIEEVILEASGVGDGDSSDSGSAAS